jgi:nickel/cobalt transporter (NiCoT) family protein
MTAGLCAVLVAFNLAAWGWALVAFLDHPVLLGTALLAYSLGLRHAVDADHIAAIDNVTRKLMHDGEQPIAAGFFFSLGHSTIVVLASIAIAIATPVFGARLDFFRGAGAIGTSISALFLLAIAIMNLMVLTAVYREFRRVDAGEPHADARLAALLAGRGLLARMFRPMFRMVRRSWHMYPLGFLFALGFDTATEIGALGIAATQAAHGIPIRSIMVFSALFTAGMSLVDTTDGILMAGAYGWAFAQPFRRLSYNVTVTFVSVVIAAAVGSIEALGLVGDRFNFAGTFWDGVAVLNGDSGTIGWLVIAVFIASWVAFALIYRVRGHRQAEAGIS